MKKIKIKDKIVLVDDDDYERVINFKYKWNINNTNYTKSATYNPKQYIVFLHRFIMGLEKGDKRVVDHINHNKLDNRKSNLRVCTQAENCRNNQIKKNNISGYKGVVIAKDKRNKKYCSTVRYNKTRYFLGYYKTAQEASEVYEQKAKELFGEFYNKEYN